MMNCYQNDSRRKVMIGELPEDFLRISDYNSVSSANSSHPESDRSHVGLFSNGTGSDARGDHIHSTCHPEVNYHGNVNTVASNPSATFYLTIIEADLNTNYGIGKMDPYVRVRFGHTCIRTPTHLRGGKRPTWNKEFHLCLPRGIRTIFFDVYIEHTLVPDNRIAWTNFTIPDSIFSGEYLNKWLPLSGRHGDESEGKLHIISFMVPLSMQQNVPYASAPVMPLTVPSVIPGVYTTANIYPQIVPYPSGVALGLPNAPVIPSQPLVYNMNPGTAGYFPGGVQPQPSGHQQATNPNGVSQNQNASDSNLQEDVNLLKEMFPNYDKDVIRDVLESCKRNKNDAVNKLMALSMEN